MRQEQRHEVILNLLKTRNEITLEDIIEHIGKVSEVTIRRDLQKLNEEGKLVRIHGGARSLYASSILYEDSYAMRYVTNIDLKEEIAKKAKKIITKNNRYFIDSGTTCNLLANVFPDVSCTIYTNALDSIFAMKKLVNPTIHLFGGNLFKESNCTNGDIVVVQAKDVFYDVAFIGATGYVSKIGFMTSVPDDYVLKRTIINNSRNVVILMDHTKLGKMGTNLEALPSEVNFVICDSSTPADVVNEWGKYGITVL